MLSTKCKKYLCPAERKRGQTAVPTSPFVRVSTSAHFSQSQPRQLVLPAVNPNLMSKRQLKVDGGSNGSQATFVKNRIFPLRRLSGFSLGRVARNNNSRALTN